MDNVLQTVALLRKQTELELQLMNGQNATAATEYDLEVTRRRLAAHPLALNAVLQTARALRRAPDAVTAKDVATWSNAG